MGRRWEEWWVLWWRWPAWISRSLSNCTSTARSAAEMPGMEAEEGVLVLVVIVLVVLAWKKLCVWGGGEKEEVSTFLSNQDTKNGPRVVPPHAGASPAVGGAWACPRRVEEWWARRVRGCKGVGVGWACLDLGGASAGGGERRVPWPLPHDRPGARPTARRAQNNGGKRERKEAKRGNHKRV